MLVEYLFAIITVTVLKIQKKTETALLLFYRGQVGIVFGNCRFEHWNASYIVYDDIWSVCAEFIVLK